MLLSHAIMMNGMCKPQGFGADSIVSLDAPCALGGALQSVGIDNSAFVLALKAYHAVAAVWPWSAASKTPPCPLCAFRPISNNTMGILWHLNDTHRWTRAQIAEWVASVEPKDEAREEVIEQELVEVRD